MASRPKREKSLVTIAAIGNVMMTALRDKHLATEWQLVLNHAATWRIR